MNVPCVVQVQRITYRYNTKKYSNKQFVNAQMSFNCASCSTIKIFDRAIMYFGSLYSRKWRIT